MFDLFLGLSEENHDSSDEVDACRDDVEEEASVYVVEKLNGAWLWVTAGSCEGFYQEEEEYWDELYGEEVVEGEIASEVSLVDVGTWVFDPYHACYYLVVQLYLEDLADYEIDGVGDEMGKGEVVSFF